MTSQQPGIGDTVHYVARGSLDGRFPPACRAATITEVHPADDDVVGLYVANPTGLFFHPLADEGVTYDEVSSDGKYTPGSWHWPHGV